MPGPTDVLVGVELVVVNLVDTLVRSGAYPTLTPFPFVVGRDLPAAVDLLALGGRIVLLAGPPSG